MPVILVFRRQRQEDREFKASLDYRERTCLKKCIHLLCIFTIKLIFIIENTEINIGEKVILVYRNSLFSDFCSTRSYTEGFMKQIQLAQVTTEPQTGTSTPRFVKKLLMAKPRSP
jgi:hypothetical protein